MRRAWAFAFAACGIGCSAIIGTRDLTFDPDTVDPTTEAGTDGGPANDGGGNDANPNTCNADLTSDARNCGRCGHDCQGGTCTASQCDSFELAGGLDTPTGIAVDDDSVYLTLTLSNVVVKLGKTAGATATTIASSQTLAFGIAIDGTTLYWSNRDFPFDGATNKGGVMKCTIADCQATIANVTSGNYAQNVKLAGDYLYFVENNASRVKWIKKDGTDVHMADTGGAMPYGIAGDGQFVYFNSTSSSLDRVPFAGGTPVSFASYGPGYDARGDIVIDGDYVYYTYVDSNGAGQVVGAPKDTANVTRRNFGPNPAPLSPLQMAFDETYIYWSVGAQDANGDPSGTGGELRACHKTGCTANEPIVLMRHLVSTGPIGLDQTSVYLAVSGTFAAPTGSLRRVAKP